MKIKCYLTKKKYSGNFATKKFREFTEIFLKVLITFLLYSYNIFLGLFHKPNTCDISRFSSEINANHISKIIII